MRLALIKMASNYNGNYICRQTAKKPQPDIISGKTCYDLPVKEINRLSKRVVSAHTGPGKGLTLVNRQRKTTAFELPADAEDVDFIDEDFGTESSPSPASSRPTSAESIKLSASARALQVPAGSSSCSSDSDESGYRPTAKNSSSDSIHSSATIALRSGGDNLIAGVANWNAWSERAYGLSTTLYEGHPRSGAKAGEPIADAFGIVVRENSAILALADGVNWGERASLAAKCAVHGCLDYLNRVVYGDSGTAVTSTMDIFVALLRSFWAAHDLILKEDGMLTTLTVAVVAQLANSSRFVVCTCNVGDSLAYVYSKKHGVREITQGEC